MSMRHDDLSLERMIRQLPHCGMSKEADRKLRALLHERMKADKSSFFANFSALFRPFVMMPAAFALLIVSVGVYGVYSPSVVQGDALYAFKSYAESTWYPEDAEAEERVAYHLWLSDRRYDEVTEIVHRLDSGELTLVPAARAQDLEGSPLEEALVDTLDRATQHVDLAFLIADEVQDIQRVLQLQQNLQQSLDRQKTFLAAQSPALDRVKLQKKLYPRLRRMERELLAQQRDEEVLAADTMMAAVEEDSQELDELQDATDQPIAFEEEVIDEFAADTDAPVALEEAEEVQVPSIAAVEAVPEVSSRMMAKEVPVPVVEKEEEESVENAQAFVQDRLAYQESLLRRLQETVESAQKEGATKVDLAMQKSVPTPEVFLVLNDGSKKDAVIKKAMVVHFNTKQKMLEIEITALKNSQVIAQNASVAALNMPGGEEKVGEEGISEKDEMKESTTPAWPAGRADAQGNEEIKEEEIQEEVSEESEDGELVEKNMLAMEADEKGEGNEEMKERGNDELNSEMEESSEAEVMALSSVSQDQKEVKEDNDDKDDEEEERDSAEDGAGEEVEDEDEGMKESTTADGQGNEETEKRESGLTVGSNIMLEEAADADQDLAGNSEAEEVMDEEEEEVFDFEAALKAVPEACRAVVKLQCSNDQTQQCLREEQALCEEEQAAEVSEDEVVPAPFLQIEIRKTTIDPALKIQILEQELQRARELQEQIQQLQGMRKGALEPAL